MDEINIGRVMVPTADQDAAIKWYSEKLGCTVAVDVPFAEGERWVELALSGGGAGIALVPPRGEYQTGRNMGVALDVADPKAAYEELKANGVECDEPMGGDGTVPFLFFFKDGEGNQLMMVERPPAAS